MPKFTVVSPVKHDGEAYAPGGEIELTAAQAPPLLQAGAIAAPKAVREEKKEPPKE